jgi:hypothetical protein
MAVAIRLAATLQTEDAFLGQLGKVNRFEVKGNKLMLFENEKKLLEFTEE